MVLRDRFRGSSDRGRDTHAAWPFDHINRLSKQLETVTKANVRSPAPVLGEIVQEAHPLRTAVAD
jgi:hypothetical protein